MESPFSCRSERNTDPLQVAIVIPARYASSRFPGKPLTPLKGATGQGKSLVHRTWEAASRAKGANLVMVATDDQRIVDEVQSFGGEALITSSNCKNGTERCAEALLKLDEKYDLVINVQGDAPLSPPEFIESLIDALTGSNHPQVVTPVLRCDGEILSRFQRDREKGRVGATTVVFGQGGNAFYFSKEIIPWCDRQYPAGELTPVFHHVGIYGYTREALKWYASSESGRLELQEGLEQLRFIEGGVPITCVEVEAHGRNFWELNNPSDLKYLEQELKSLNIE